MRRYGHLLSDDLGRIADAFDAAAKISADVLRTAPARRGVLTGTCDNVMTPSDC